MGEGNSGGGTHIKVPVAASEQVLWRVKESNPTTSDPYSTIVPLSDANFA